MNQPSKDSRLLEFNCNERASAAAIRECEIRADIQFPGEYIEFLCTANGGEGLIGKAYVILWRVEELSEFNEGYEVDQFAPGLFLFGSDGGGEGFAFDMRSDEKRVVSVPFVGIAVELANAVAPTFDVFLDGMWEV